jgi:hypothetical protein
VTVPKVNMECCTKNYHAEFSRAYENDCHGECWIQYKAANSNIIKLARTC